MKTGFFDIENWREIGVSLARNKTRTFLTAFGIFWGTAMLAMLLGGSEGLERMLRRNFEGFATNSAVINSNRRTISYKGFNKGSTWNMTNSDIELIRQIPGIEAVASITSGKTVTISAGRYSTSTPTMGVDQDFVKVMLPTINEGRFINESDQRQKSKVAVLGSNIATKIFPAGDAVGNFVNVGGIYYKVVGIASQESEINLNGSQINDQIVMPASTLAQSFNLGDEVGVAMISVESGYTPTQLKPKIFRAIRVNHLIDPNDDQAMFMFDVSEQFAMVDSLFMGITLLALFVGIGTLIAGIIGVGNIMWIIVKERTTEIGIRRAIGAKPADILTQILSEGVALTIIAGMAGISFATFVLYIVEQIVKVPFQMGFIQAVAIMLIFTVLGIVAGVIPSLKAMKIKPIEAINDK